MGAIALAACLCRAGVAAAGPDTVSLRYDVYTAGVPSLTLHLQVDVSPRSYRIVADMETQGIIGFLFPWTMRADVEGAVAGEDLRPALYRSTSLLFGRERTARLAYAGDGTVTVETNRVPGDERRQPVDAAMRKGTVDVLTALLRVARRLEASGHCAVMVPVFDGRRRYDLTFADADPATAARTVPANARTCIASMQRLAGFLKSGLGWDEDDDARAAAVAVARVFADAPMMPVRLELATAIGMAQAVLEEVAYRGVALASPAIRPVEEPRRAPPLTASPRDDRQLMLPRGD
ncbi:MAG: DUF3108 domain-containing protein [Alphaproteobacteria bacterium]|nr:DUF3108 domain-containing protein [Alphaproteobacteria bacterium]